LIYSGGTAGLRLSEMRDANYTDSLLDSTRVYFKSLGVHIPNAEQQVRIINGSEEGLSGWISTNMLMNQLFDKHDPETTYGVSDMGGMCYLLMYCKNCFYCDYRCQYTTQFHIGKCEDR
jgi:Golgi nucleoside diphosphatase